MTVAPRNTMYVREKPSESPFSQSAVTRPAYHPLAASQQRRSYRKGETITLLADFPTAKGEFSQFWQFDLIGCELLSCMARVLILRPGLKMVWILRRPVRFALLLLHIPRLRIRAREMFPAAIWAIYLTKHSRSA